MTAEDLLNRLGCVKQTASDRWLAKCPAHEDRSPSLSIRVTGDGVVLLHCFAGCCAADIVAALGLTLADLFPRTTSHQRSPRRNSIPAADRLAVIDHEATVVCVIADQVARDFLISDEDHERLLQAARRISEARHG